MIIDFACSSNFADNSAVFELVLSSINSRARNFSDWSGKILKENLNGCELKWLLSSVNLTGKLYIGSDKRASASKSRVNCTITRAVKQSKVKILTENSKTPLSRALALASFLGTEYPPALGARTAPPAKDLMAFGSVLAHNQHNIGRCRRLTFHQIRRRQKKRRRRKIFADKLHNRQCSPAECPSVNWVCAQRAPNRIIMCAF